MIVVPDDGGFLLFLQEAHAHLAGELAAHLAEPPGERSALVAAARLHDNGWRETDADPPVDPEGRPLRFYEVPGPVYAALWRRGIARADAVDPMVGLLVGLHGARFFGRHADPLVRALHDEERARQDRVLTALGLGGTWQDLPADVRAMSASIRFLDLVSLLVCGEVADRLDTDVDGAPVHLERGEGTVTVAPWPFADAEVAVTIRGRRLAAPVAAGEVAAAVAAAPEVARTVALRPG